MWSNGVQLHKLSYETWSFQEVLALVFDDSKQAMKQTVQHFVTDLTGVKTPLVQVRVDGGGEGIEPQAPLLT